MEPYATEALESVLHNERGQRNEKTEVHNEE